MRADGSSAVQVVGRIRPLSDYEVETDQTSLFEVPGDSDVTIPPIHPPTHSLTPSLPPSLTHSLTHARTHALTHSLTH